MSASPWIVGRYEVHEAIASGGMGSVHLARQRGDAGFARLVAVKRMHAGVAADGSLARSLLDEARIGARIRHPNVVAALDLVTHEEELLFVMDYVHGESLARLLRAAARAGEDVPTAVVGAVVSDLLRGLAAVHDARSETGEALGLVHRDVSPHNVMVGADGIARVADFGIAKAGSSERNATETGQIKGKLAYLSPEQAAGEQATSATDVFAAAIVLWESLTGRPLYGGGAEVDVFRRAVAAEAAPPSTLRVGLSPDVDELVMRALSRSPDARPSALELARQVEQSLAAARPAEVAAWVERLSGETLKQRASLVAAIEARPQVQPPTPMTSTPPHAAPPQATSASHALSLLAPPPPTSGTLTPSRKTLVIAAIGALVIASLAGAAAFIGASSAAPAPSAAGSTQAPAPSYTATPSASAADSEGTTPSPPPPPSASADKKKPKAPAGDPCSPPYTVQADGKKKFKPWCL